MYRILLLEDNSDDAQLLEIELESAGLSVDIRRATTRTEYLEALDSFRPDLVISDSNLPGFSGHQALELARESSRPLPFIFLSGRTPDELETSPDMQGADAVVSKDSMRRMPGLIRELLAD